MGRFTLSGGRSGLTIWLVVAVVTHCPPRARGADLPLGTAPIVISELLAANDHTRADPQGQYDDWIELYNRGTAAVNLAGMYLTDDVTQPTKWQFPKDNAALTTVAAHGYLLVWADQEVSDAGLHAAFKLSAAGDSVALFDRDGMTLLDSVTFGPQRTDISYGRLPDAGNTWSRLIPPTPGSANGCLYQGFVEKPQFSVPHGFYTNELQVSITCPTPGAVIYYTTEGSTPGVSPGSRAGIAGTLYRGPIAVKRTTCLRAIAVRTGWYPSPVETSTYLFVDDIITQSATGAKPSADWPASGINGQVLDYGMDPDIVGDPRYRDLMADALCAIPSISLVTDLANFFDPQTGIYVHAGSEGQAWERPVSVELLRPDGGAGFQIDAGIRIRGGFSRSGSNAKHSFRLFFSSDYGLPVLKYPLFEAEGADAFENIDLRTAQNYAWSLDSFNPGQKNTFVREEFCRDLQRETGQPYTRTRYYHLYLNGQYWGLYETRERSEASYAATYFGGAPDNYDVVKTENHHAGATDGTIDAWNHLWDLCQQGFDTDARYYAVLGKKPDGTDDPSLPVHVDVVNLIDYMLGIFFTGNDDAPVTLGSGTAANNFFALRDRRPAARFGWKFFAYDNEHSLGAYSGINDDRTAPVTAGQTRDNFNPQWLHQKLMVHPEYRMLFADRAHKHLFNGGVMTPEKAIALCLSRANQINLAIIAESARWGDQRPSRVNNPYTKEDWWKEVDGYLNKTFFPVRTGIVLNQLRKRGLYPQSAAPVFQINGSYQHGGQAAVRDLLSMTDGTIYYTLDGTDPRVPGTVLASARTSPAAVRYTSPITLSRSIRVKARTLSGCKKITSVS